MRKIILIIPALFLINTLMAQHSKLNIGMEFSYDKILGQRLLLSGSGDRDLFLSGSDFNYSLAITNTQFITEQVQFKSGIMYADRDAIGVINCNRCEANTDPLPIIFQQKYLGIPLTFGYYFSDKRLRPLLELGVVNHFTLNNDIATSNTFYLEAMAGLVLAYQLSNKLSLNIGYHYQLALSNPYVMQDKDLSDRLKISRVLFGVKYHR